MSTAATTLELPDVDTLDPARVRAALRALWDEAGATRLPRSRADRLADLACAEALREARLVDDDTYPLFRLNRIGERMFVTDLPDLTRVGGVFPYEDEVVHLLDYLDGARPDQIDVVVDVGVGCGHGLLSTSAPVRIGIDVAARAGSLLRLNAAVNGEQARWLGGDAARVLGTVEELRRDDLATLVIGNLPHAPAPGRSSLARFANGGRTGADVVRSVVGALGRAAGPRCRAVLVCYSLGSSQTGRWLVPELAGDLVGPDRVRWTPLTGARMWRVAGTMSEQSPMPLSAGLPRKADCPFYASERDRDATRARYEALAAELEADGWDRLGYGILDVAPQRAAGAHAVVTAGR